MDTARMGRECIAHRVRMLNRMVTAIYDAALWDVGLKTSQYNLLVVVANRADSRPAELAKLLEMDPSTFSRNVERMCAKGWLERESTEDRRGHRMKLTTRGLALIREGYPGWESAQAEMTRRLGADGIAAVKLALRRLRA